MRLLHPSRVHLCDGSEEERRLLIRHMIHTGTLVEVNPKIRPNSYLARSDVADVARVEEQTFICSDSVADAGPTNNWRDPVETTRMLTDLFHGSMQGRTMYVVPFSMGPIGSPLSQIGVQITDSPYAVVSMSVMTRVGTPVLQQLGPEGFFVPCVHSVGMPLKRNTPDSSWPCNNAEKWIVHFPEQRRIWSFGSGYGGNALLGKKCFALRIASAMARDEGWLAEHMLIVGITNPRGVKKYFAAAFPSACGKTNMAMLDPNLPGWKVECVGDDIAWMKIGPDGRLYAINPENGFFGVAPGTSSDSNPNAMKMLDRNTIFTNCAMTEDGDVWWENMSEKPPANAVSWMRSEWNPNLGTDAAHPNARFTVPATQCPVLDPNWESPTGVPIEAIIFGGRRSNTVPLVFQSKSWEHGTFVGAMMSSETTAAAAGRRGVLRSDPFAMKPFCGYNMGDYFNHWLSFPQHTKSEKLPKIFHVNWFRKSSRGKFMWPGFGDNIRVLKWIFDRCDSKTSDGAVDTPFGILPTVDAIDTTGLSVEPETMNELLRFDPNEYKGEIARYQETLHLFGKKIPQQFQDEIDLLTKHVGQKSK